MVNPDTRPIRQRWDRLRSAISILIFLATAIWLQACCNCVEREGDGGTWHREGTWRGEYAMMAWAGGRHDALTLEIHGATGSGGTYMLRMDRNNLPHRWAAGPNPVTDYGTFAIGNERFVLHWDATTVLTLIVEEAGSSGLLGDEIEISGAIYRDDLWVGEWEASRYAQCLQCADDG